MHVALIARYVLITAAEHYRLKNDAVDLLHVFAHKPNDVTDPIIVDPIDNAHLQRRFHAGCRDVFKRAIFYLHIISNPAVFVLFLRCPIELEIHTVEPSRLRADDQVTVLSKTDSVRSDMNSVETHAVRMGDRVKKDWRENCLASRKQNIDFALRLERHSSFENGPDISHVELVNEAGCIRVHIAW